MAYVVTLLMSRLGIGLEKLGIVVGMKLTRVKSIYFNLVCKGSLREFRRIGFPMCILKSFL